MSSPSLCTKRSSAITAVPLRSPKVSFILFWNSLGAEEMPEGMRKQRYQPKEVLKVVNLREASFSGTCQNPRLASNTENTFALLRLVATSTAGRG